MYEKENPQFWRNLNPESIITLSDAQSIQDSIEAGDGAKGIDYVFKYVLKIRPLQELAEWLLFNLEGAGQDLWLMVKIVDSEINLRVYYEPAEFEPGNREDMIEREEFWLFQQPEDPDNFEFGDLRYAVEIDQTIKGEDGDQGILFRRKPQGEMHGACTCKPAKSGLERMLATIIEYFADEECENPELLILEIGDENSKVGGLIRLMLGTEVNFSEVDVLQV